MSKKEWIVGRNPVFEILRTQRRQIFRLMISESVQRKGRIAEIISFSRKLQLMVIWVSPNQLNKIGPNNQGVAVETSGYSYFSLDDILSKGIELNEAPLILILDSIQDPQNLGALLRTAEIIGVHGVLLPLRRTANITPAVVSASSGASEHIMVAKSNLSQAISRLQNENIWVVGLEDSNDSCDQGNITFQGPLAVVVGSEGSGLRQLTRNSCDQLLRLPMRGQIESYNASVAGSIALYLAWQERGFSGRKRKIH